LNTRGGTVLLGVKDEQKPTRKYLHTGWTEANTPNLDALRHAFRSVRGDDMSVEEYLIMEVKAFGDGQVAVVRVTALPEHLKFCTAEGAAYERVLDADRKITPSRIQEQEVRKSEMEHDLKLKPVPDVQLRDLSLQRINELVLPVNEGQQRTIETIKSSLDDAVPFLDRRRFLLKDRSISTLGVLVCAMNPEDALQTRSHVDAFVEIPNEAAQDKKTFRDNILQLMESAQNWTLRNIMTGISIEAGGTRTAEYPAKLIRESINNALAHRDYSINRPVQLTIHPRQSLSIRNPGKLPGDLVFEDMRHAIPFRRIFANSRARNPRLADVLKLHDKWEGKGIGMSDLVHFALADEIDIPYYLFHSSDELSLFIPAGRVLDEATRAWFELADGLIDIKSAGQKLTSEHFVVLAYLLKSERQNRQGRYTLSLTPSNNHFKLLGDLERQGLVVLHPSSEQTREVYVVCRELADDNCFGELKELFGKDFEHLKVLGLETLNMVALPKNTPAQAG